MDDMLARCRAIVDELNLPRTFDMTQLCDRIATARNRPIHLVPHDIPPGGPCGAWIATDHADVIVFEKSTSLIHQEHIIGHELGHLLSSRRRTPGRRLQFASHLFPELDPRTVRSILGRSDYTAAEEREAETIGSLLLLRKVNAWRHAGDETSRVVARMQRSLEGIDH